MTTISNKPNIPDSYIQVKGSSFKDIYVDENAGVMLTVWNGNSKFISEDDYKEDSYAGLEHLKNYKLKYIIADVRLSLFHITHELQLWYSQNIVPPMSKLGIKRCGIIIEENLQLMSSIEEIATDVHKREGVMLIPHRFFASIEEAEKWVKRIS